MGEIKDFNCTYDNSAGINGEVTEGLGLTFPDAYLHADTMAKLSRALKEHDGAAFCELPFCHTVEAEAMGGLVNYGNDKTGPRAKEYICTKTEELLELQPIDFSKGRIHEVLQYHLERTDRRPVCFQSYEKTAGSDERGILETGK